MPTYSYTVHEGQQSVENIPVNTFGATTATFNTSYSSVNGFVELMGVIVEIGNNQLTVTIPASMATSVNFPAYYCIDLNNRKSAVSGVIRFEPLQVDPTGIDSTMYSGTGPPNDSVGANPGEYYLDTTTGNLYKLEV